MQPTEEDRRAMPWSYCVGSGHAGLNPVVMDTATWQECVQATCPVCKFHEIVDDEGNVVDHETPNRAGWTPQALADHGY